MDVRLKKLHRIVLSALHMGQQCGPAPRISTLDEGVGESQGPVHLLEQRQTTRSRAEHLWGIRQLGSTAAGGQDQSSPETIGSPGPSGEERRRDKDSIPGEMEHGLVTIYDTSQQPTGLAPDLTWSSLHSPKDPLADDSVEVLDGVASFKPGAVEIQANGGVRTPNEDHAIPGGTRDNSEVWPSEEVLVIDIETEEAEETCGKVTPLGPDTGRATPGGTHLKVPSTEGPSEEEERYGRS